MSWLVELLSALQLHSLTYVANHVVMTSSSLEPPFRQFILHYSVFLNFLTIELVEIISSWEAASSVATQEFPDIRGGRRFITVFARALHWSLSLANWIQSITIHCIAAWSMFVLLYQFLLCFPSGFVSHRNRICIPLGPMRSTLYTCSLYLYFAKTWNITIYEILRYAILSKLPLFHLLWVKLILFSILSILTFRPSPSFSVRDLVSHPY
jgi:hypothetical protein